MYIEGRFFSQLVSFLEISDRFSYKKYMYWNPAKSSTKLEKVYLAGPTAPLAMYGLAISFKRTLPPVNNYEDIRSQSFSKLSLLEC